MKKQLYSILALLSLSMGILGSLNAADTASRARLEQRKTNFQRAIALLIAEENPEKNELTIKALQGQLDGTIKQLEALDLKFTSDDPEAIRQRNQRLIEARRRREEEARIQRIQRAGLKNTN